MSTLLLCILLSTYVVRLFFLYFALLTERSWLARIIIVRGCCGWPHGISSFISIVGNPGAFIKLPQTADLICSVHNNGNLLLGLVPSSSPCTTFF